MSIWTKPLLDWPFGINDSPSPANCGDLPQATQAANRRPGSSPGPEGSNCCVSADWLVVDFPVTVEDPGGGHDGVGIDGHFEDFGKYVTLLVNASVSGTPSVPNAWFREDLGKEDRTEGQPI